MLSQTLKSNIKSLWDSFWSGGIANPLTAIEQITYLIFLKRLEDLDDEASRWAHERGEQHLSIFENADQFRWSHIKQMESQARLRHMQDVFEWLKSLEGAEERFRDAVFVIPSANLLQRAVTIIDDLFVPSQNYDTLGDIYEYLLGEIAEAGKNGQFRTPRHIIRAMIDMVDPRLGDRIADPACGTGGFLVNSYLHILKENTSPDIRRFEADGTPFQAYGDLLSREQIEALRSNHFYGYDFDRTMVRLSWMNMIQHGMQNPNMNYADTLGSRFNERLSRGEVGGFDVVLANPPFTGSIDASDIGDSLQSLGTIKTELLFVELILQLLNVGGRAAVIVPEGLLFGSTRAHIALRRRLVTENQLNAVISLPSGVFQPYTGVKSSILVFTVGGATEEVWFYDLRADGFSLDAKRTARPEHNDLWDVILKFRLRFGDNRRPAFVSNDEEWQHWRDMDQKERSISYLNPLISVEQLGNEQDLLEGPMVQDFETIELTEPLDWIAPVDVILENDFNLSAGRYKPYTLGTVKYTPPAQIIRELLDIEQHIQTGLNNLIAMLEEEQE